MNNTYVVTTVRRAGFFKRVREENYVVRAFATATIADIIALTDFEHEDERVVAITDMTLGLIVLQDTRQP